MSMATTGIFTTHRYVIPSETNREHRLFIFGDIHRDSPLCAEERWFEFLDKAKSAKDALFLGMGDYLDNFSTSERDILGDPKLHESTKKNLEDIGKRKVRDLAKEMQFMSGRLIGLLEGNHYAVFSDGTTSTQYLCNLLGCKYLGVATFVRLAFSRKHESGGKAGLSFDIHAHHGKGASRMVGGSINRVAQMLEHCDADLVVMGHDHKRGIIPGNPRLYLHESGGSLMVKEKQSWVARSGSFLAAYRDGEASYNVDAARGPCNLGHVELHITFRRKDTTIAQGKRKGTEWLEVRGVA